MYDSTAGEIEPRGIYKAPYRIDGCEVLYAVTSWGDRLQKIVVLRPGVSEERAAEWLAELLDRRDPLPPAPPQLKLVKCAPVSSDRGVVRRLSPDVFVRLLKYGAPPG